MKNDVWQCEKTSAGAGYQLIDPLGLDLSTLPNLTHREKHWKRVVPDGITWCALKDDEYTLQWVDKGS